jgi:hypothetical protein
MTFEKYGTQKRQNVCRRRYGISSVLNVGLGVTGIKALWVI